MKKRRLIIAVIVFVIGESVYVNVSGAPPRVHVVTILIELALLFVATYFAWAFRRTPWQRMTGAIIGVMTVSLIGTWASAKVIASLTPLEPIYFLMDLVTSFIQATTFIGVVWLIDFAIDQLRNQR